MNGCIPYSPVMSWASGGWGNPAMSDAARSTSPSIRTATSASAVCSPHGNLTATAHRQIRPDSIGTGPS